MSLKILPTRLIKITMACQVFFSFSILYARGEEMDLWLWFYVRKTVKTVQQRQQDDANCPVNFGNGHYCKTCGTIKSRNLTEFQFTHFSQTMLCIIDDYHTFQMHPANVCVPDHQLQSFFHAQFSRTKSVIGTKLNVTKISTAALQRFASSFTLHLNSATPAKQQSHRSHYMQSTDYISQTGIKTKEN